MGRLLMGILVILFVLAVSITAYIKAQDLDPQELLQRCQKSRPQWQSYQEDIKGQVGASPVAKWKGRILRVAQVQAGVEVTVLLETPWDSYAANLPILLRDPLGAVYTQSHVDGQGKQRIYHFALETHSAAQTLPWIEIHYPHTERRISLDQEGAWQQPDTP